MGAFSSIGAIRAVERLKTGRSQSEMLSVADIVMMSVCLTDAYKKLSRDQYKEVQFVYDELQKNKEKKAYTLDEYMDEWTKITFRFDSVAPYELYCGNTEIAANMIRMKQDPAFYEMRDLVLNNPDFLTVAREINEIENEFEEIADEVDEETNEEIEESDDSYNDIVGEYEYKESYVCFDESDRSSEIFDAELDVDIYISEEHDCTIVIDGEEYFGTWDHIEGVYYDFSDFEGIDLVVLRGLSEYKTKYLNDMLVIYEDIPQVSGISLIHIFEKE